MNQISDTLLMIRPTAFCLNQEAAKSNSFQKSIDGLNDKEIHELALKEFEDYVKKLIQLDVDVIVIDDLSPSKSPDSIFPNNWISTHEDGTIITYPMEPINRRQERREDIINSLSEKFGYEKLIQLEDYESDQLFLEGTGSVIFDKNNQLAYAAISSRTHEEPLLELCDLLNFRPVIFRAYGINGEPIYHTNVVMFVAKDYVGICTEIIDKNDQSRVLNIIEDSGKSIIEFTAHQAHECFAGNMIQVKNKRNETILLLSEKAMKSLSDDQLKFLKAHNDHLLPISIPTIETIGGGSVRCMVAEIFYN